MALRKPLVIVSGEVQQLQAGDDLNVPISGTIDITLTNNNAGAVVIGTPVYAVAADAYDKAKADAAGTSKLIGLAVPTSTAVAASGTVAVNGIFVATTAQWDAVAGTTGGLTFGTNYYLSAATAGLLTSTAPSTAGQYNVLVGVALSTTELRLNIQPRILL